MIKPIPGEYVGSLNENDHNIDFTLAVKINELVQAVNKLQMASTPKKHGDYGAAA